MFRLMVQQNCNIHLMEKGYQHYTPKLIGK